MTVRCRSKRKRVTAPESDEVLTQQHMADATDINRIVQRYAQTGMWDHINPREPMYGDFTEANSLQEAFEIIRNAEADFQKLPSAVRKAASYDPAEMLRMLASPEGAFALQEAGLPFVNAIPNPDPASQKLAQSGTSPTAPSSEKGASAPEGTAAP